MSEENIDMVRRLYEEVVRTGTFVRENAASDFVWDMSHFEGWPEQQVYQGADGAQEFLDDWTGAWDDWTLEIDETYDAGDKVVVVVHQRGRSRATGMTLEGVLVQTWTVRDGWVTRMDMYSDVGEALKAAGLEE